jgi:hypothetical protein
MTLVPVGPVRRRPPRGPRKLRLSLRARNSAGGARPSSAAWARVSRSTTPPAASLLPSMPSVAREANRAGTGKAASGSAAATAISWFRPPCPGPRTVTVVSPPARRQTGRPVGWPEATHSRSTANRARAASRASPSSREVKRSGRKPHRRASRAAASRLSRLLPTTWARTLRKIGSPGLGVSGRRARIPARRCARTAAGTRGRMPRRLRTPKASAKVVGSGEAGPEAIVERSSPTTSDSTSALTRAGAARRARPPPLRRDRCLRTAFSSWMVAPACMRRAVVRALSRSERPPAGAGRSAEAPPDKRSRRRSSAPNPRRRRSTSAAARRPRRSGIGWPASRTRRPVGAGPPAWVTTRPPPSRRPRRTAASSAIGRAALPTASSTTRPLGRGSRSPASHQPPWGDARRLLRTAARGSAASSPAFSIAAAALRSRPGVPVEGRGLNAWRGGRLGSAG